MNLSAERISARDFNGHINSNNTVQIYYNSGAENDALAKWVSDLDFSQNHSQAFQLYTEGTLFWVGREASFAAWLENGGLLWCSGKPGAGKTVFASFVINWLLQHSRQDPCKVSAVCYVYCRYDLSAQPSPLDIFAAILRQLILRCKSPNLQLGLVKRVKVEGQHLTLQDILQILQTNFLAIPNIFIIVDALDECPNEETRHTVLLHLQKLTSVHILVTSRPLPTIQNAMDGALSLTVSAHDDDIKTHFSFQTKTNPKLAKLVPKVSAPDVEARLIEKADGMFLLAHLHGKHLARQTNKNQLLRALDTLSTEVTASYDKTLQYIRQRDEEERLLAFQVMSWILHALRPLTLIELQHALAGSILDRMVEEDDLVDEETIISSCAGLIITEKDVEGRQIPRFIHYTVREYLRESRTDFPSNVEIATRSMKVLSLPGIQSRPPKHPLFDYAAYAWPSLVQNHEHDQAVLDLALCQLRDSATFDILTGSNEFPSSSPGKTSGATALHLIAAFGLVRTCEAFMRTVDAASLINVPDTLGQTALHYAARGGQWKIVEALLRYPFLDVNCRNVVGQTPLLVSVLHRRSENVKLSQFFTQLLGQSVVCGYLEVIKKLVNHPHINVNMGNRYGETALLQAAQDGDSAVVRLLFNHPDLDVNSRDKQGRTALFRAVEKGHLAVVNSLLTHPEIDVKTQYAGRSLLSWAAEVGHPAVVKMLLAIPSVDVNSRSGNGRTALSLGAEKGHLAVVKEILAHPDVDPNSKDTTYGFTPLHQAVGAEQMEVVTELLAFPSVAVNAKNDDGQTPLFQAVENGDLEMVYILLSHPHITVDTRDNRGWTPLSYAAHSGNLEMVKLLVDQSNVSINEEDTNFGLTPLVWATLHYGFAIRSLPRPFLVRFVLGPQPSDFLLVVNFLLDTGKYQLPGNRRIALTG